MLRLINDVLDLSKVEAGKMDFHAEEIDLQLLVAEVVGVLRSVAGRSAVRFETDHDTGIGIKFSADSGTVTIRTRVEGPTSFRAIQWTGSSSIDIDVGFMNVRAWQLLALLACSCSGGDARWEEYPKLFEFGSFSGIDADGHPYASTLAGVLKTDGQSWKRIALPGSDARYFVAQDGREFASSYGIYSREPGADEWKLLPGSRPLAIDAVTQGADRTVYAATNRAYGPNGVEAHLYASAAGSSAWTQLDLDASSTAFVTDFSGAVYAAQGTSRLLRFDGVKYTEMPVPMAQTFDFEGNRYQVTQPTGGLAAAFTVERVSASGALEPWAEIDPLADTSLAFSALYGFGKDGRFYALVSDDVLLGEDYGSGDILSLGVGETKWSLAVSPSSYDEGEVHGPVLLSNYRGGFERDGTLFFGGCESGCAGSGNAFSYGLYRLHLKGQP